MEFSTIGEYWHYKYCKQLDFLPFECDGCHYKFCKNHRRWDDHECEAPRDLGIVKKNVISEKEINKKKERWIGCRKRLTTLTKMKWKVCKFFVWFKHRFQSDHDWGSHKRIVREEQIRKNKIQVNEVFEKNLPVEIAGDKPMEIIEENKEVFVAENICPICNQSFIEIQELIIHSETHFQPHSTSEPCSNLKEPWPICHKLYPIPELITHCELVHALA